MKKGTFRVMRYEIGTADIVIRLGTLQTDFKLKYYV